MVASQWIPACAGMTKIDGRAFSSIFAKAGSELRNQSKALYFCHLRESGDPYHTISEHHGNAALDKHPCVYILASQRNDTLYISVTGNLLARVWQHKQDLAEGFTKKYAVHELVYFELADSMESAICREKQLKKWNRQWKIDLVEKNNPGWWDLYAELIGN